MGRTTPSSMMAGPVSDSVSHSDAMGEVVRVSHSASKADQVDRRAARPAAASAKTAAGTAKAAKPAESRRRSPHPRPDHGEIAKPPARRLRAKAATPAKARRPPSRHGQDGSPASGEGCRSAGKAQGGSAGRAQGGGQAGKPAPRSRGEEAFRPAWRHAGQADPDQGHRPGQRDASSTSTASIISTRSRHGRRRTSPPSKPISPSTAASPAKTGSARPRSSPRRRPNRRPRRRGAK